MKFRITNEPWVMRSYVPELVSIAGKQLWEKRILNLRKFARSPYLAQIASDYHWIELQLADELAKRGDPNALVADDRWDPISRRVLRFAQTVVEVHGALQSEGRRKLEGRIRDALQAETGFAALYQEMELAAVLVNQDFDVKFPDLDGTGRADISFQQGRVMGFVECKALSADAGRKIHRKHFYRFIDDISEDIFLRASSGKDELIVITLKDRLTTDFEGRGRLAQAARNVLRSPHLAQVTEPEFLISREPFSQRFQTFPPMSESEFYKEAQGHFGQACHIAGARTESGGCLIVMRSEREDDHSKPQLEAMKEATEQLSTDNPGFVALQFNEISSADLRLPHLARRCWLLSNYIFHETSASHIAAVFIAAFGATSVAADAVAYSALTFWNAQCKFDVRGLPFHNGSSQGVADTAASVD